MARQQPGPAVMESPSAMIRTGAVAAWAGCTTAMRKAASSVARTAEMMDRRSMRTPSAFRYPRDPDAPKRGRSNESGCRPAEVTDVEQCRDGTTGGQSIAGRAARLREECAGERPGPAARA